MGFLPSFRIRLTSLWPALSALAAATLLLWWQLPSTLGGVATEQMLATARAHANMVRTFDGLEGPQLQVALQRLVAGQSQQLTLIAADGRVLADSSKTYDGLLAMENLGLEPEVAQARQWGSGTAVRQRPQDHADHAFAAIEIFTQAGERRVLRVSQPLGQLRTVRQSLARAMAGATTVGLLVIALVSWYLDRRFFRPMTRIIDGAGELAGGDLAARIRPPRQSDLGRLAGVLNHLASRLQAQVGELQGERNQLRAILSSMSEGVLVTDSDGRALLANPAFLHLFGHTGSIRGWRPLEISRQPDLDQVIRFTLADGAESVHQRQLRTPEERSVVLTAGALKGSGGVVVVARDVTEEDRTMTMRREFVANVSHELKTPLSAIRGYAETLEDWALEDPETSQRYLGRILAQCQRLQLLLDDLLTLSRLEGTAEAPRLELIDLEALTYQARELVSAAAQDRKVEILIEPHGSLPQIEGIYNDLERMLVNLLENAVKYNHPGGEVFVRLDIEDEDVVLEVEDTGIGIPHEALPRIFERFFRVDSGRARTQGGTGLGLSIVKHIAQGHGGTVEVESVTGEGSTFRVFLPWKAEDPENTGFVNQGGNGKSLGPNDPRESSPRLHRRATSDPRLGYGMARVTAARRR
ncbi:MAG: ATP-binding protein [Acidobacteriota bacterium]